MNFSVRLNRMRVINWSMFQQHASILYNERKGKNFLPATRCECWMFGAQEKHFFITMPLNLSLFCLSAFLLSLQSFHLLWIFCFYANCLRFFLILLRLYAAKRIVANGGKTTWWYAKNISANLSYWSSFHLNYFASYFNMQISELFLMRMVGLTPSLYEISDKKKSPEGNLHCNCAISKQFLY